MELKPRKISKDDMRLDEVLNVILSGKINDAVLKCEALIGKKKNPAIELVYGHALLRLGLVEKGLKHLENGGIKTVKEPYCLYRLGHLWNETGNWEQASQCYKKALRYDKEFWEVHYNIGNIYKSQFQYNKALEHYTYALKLQPDYKDALFNMGLVYEALGDFDKAKEKYEKLVSVNLNDEEALCGLGRCFRSVNDYKKAERYWYQAIELNPKSADAYNCLVDTQIKLGVFDRAQKILDKAIEAGINHETIYLNMGRILYIGERNEDLARQVFEQALEHYPHVTEIWSALVGIMLDNSEYAEAEEVLDTLKASGLEVWYIKQARARLYFETSRLDAAEKVVLELLDLDPNNGMFISSLLAFMSYNSSHSPDILFEAHKKFGARLEEGKESALPPLNQRVTDKSVIKIGYVSPDFREHATSRFMEPIIANHDRDRFHITLYSNIKITDKVTERLKGYADEWVDTVALSDFQLAQKVREDKIDILVDLAGHTPGNRLGVFGYKPAPIQASWMGYPYTTGMQSIDYYFVEPEMVKNGAQACFTEQLKYLCYAEEKTRPCVVDWLPEKTCLNHALASEKNGYVTFGCFNRIEKLSIEMIDVWVEILSTLESSRLRIQNRNFNARHEREKWLQLFVSKGIDEGRLEFMGAESLTEYLNSLGEIDVGLDTFPYNGSTVSLDMLKVGVPFVTLAGSKSHSQTGQALLASKGMAKYIASSYQEYKDTVLHIALNVDERLCIKNALLTETINNTDREWVSKVLEELYLDILPV